MFVTATVELREINTHIVNHDRSSTFRATSFTKQLIQKLDCSIAVNKGFVLALNYEIRLLELNSSEHSKVYSFCPKLEICYINLLRGSLQK